ncbi:hypothetical protein MACK_001923 [Theileria orientalis]|uniref:Midasin n=1 Tax=Theileria orientalis TaxID=68886 RepID=A0A976MAX6_THEOR|nr:hypothetical protein MACK_001923 [Theileria orientalis]
MDNSTILLDSCKIIIAKLRPYLYKKNRTSKRLDLNRCKNLLVLLEGLEEYRKIQYSYISIIYTDSFYDEHQYANIFNTLFRYTLKQLDTPYSCKLNISLLLLVSCLINYKLCHLAFDFVPDIALYLTIEILESFSEDNDYVIEILLLAHRLRNDFRIGRLCTKFLRELKHRKSVCRKINKLIALQRSTPIDLVIERLRLLSNLSDVLSLNNISNLIIYSKLDKGGTPYFEEPAWFVELKGTEQFRELCELSELMLINEKSKLKVPEYSLSASFKRFRMNRRSAPNLIQTHNHVSYVRERTRCRRKLLGGVVDDAHLALVEGYVTLDFSEQVISNLLFSMDISLAVVVCGECKNYYLRVLSRRLGIDPSKVNNVYTDETTDVKSLIGNWVSRETLGEFTFSYGLLARAMKEGRWLIFDSYISDTIYAFLIDVCSRGYLYVTELNEKIYAHENFQVFIIPYSNYSTINELRREIARGQLSIGTRNTVISGIEYLFGGTFNNEDVPLVNIPSPSSGHVLKICETLYPNENIKELVVGAYKLETTHGEYLKVTISKLMRLFNRIYPYLNVTSMGRETRHKTYMGEDVKKLILYEFYNIFVSEVDLKEVRVDIMIRIAHMLGVIIHSLDEVLNSFTLIESILESIISNPTITDLNERHGSINRVHILNKADNESGEVVDIGNVLSEEELMLEKKVYQSIKEFDGHNSEILRMVYMSFVRNEPVLLVGETGTGKTALVQKFAEITGNTLKVFVFSENSDSTDLIGSYYPVDESDDSLDNAADAGNKRTPTRKKGIRFKFCEGILLECIRNGYWLLLDEINLAQQDLLYKLYSLLHHVYEMNGQKWKGGDNVLDDGINGSDSTNGNIDISENDGKHYGKMEFYEYMDKEVPVHKNFRLFSCMNPAVIRKNEGYKFNTGKKELPETFSKLFTTIYVDPISTFDSLFKVATYYTRNMTRSVNLRELCVFYLNIIELVNKCEIEDGSLKLPNFTLRNFVRSVQYIVNVSTREFRPIHDINKLMYDSISANFLSTLGTSSVQKALELLPSYISEYSKLNHNVSRGGEGNSNRGGMSSIVSGNDGINLGNSKDKNNNHGQVHSFYEYSECNKYINIHGYWVKLGTPNSRSTSIDSLINRKREVKTESSDDYILCSNNVGYLIKLVRILTGSRVPILLQGPTAAGKTSLVKYLCKLTNHTCVRINNHEHTDITEYIGQHHFQGGRMVFEYGTLVLAMKYGYWVILDELNLASSEILECLNRILDDNREIYISETNETIKCHEDFMIFATQNPSDSIYGGRKQLSRSFTNRFIQLFFDDISNDDLKTILHKRCLIPYTKSQIVVNLYQKIRNVTINSILFQKNQILITTRDLIKLSNRIRDKYSNEEILVYYYSLIAEKLYNVKEKESILSIINDYFYPNKERNTDTKAVNVINNMGTNGSSKPLELLASSEEAVEQDRKKRRRLNQKYTISEVEQEYVEMLRIGNGMFDVDELKRFFVENDYYWIDGYTDRIVYLVITAISNRENVLLVGETGIGKTTIVQLLSKFMNVKLNIFNCNQNTEASDFIGSICPTTDTSIISSSPDNGTKSKRKQDNSKMDKVGVGRVDEMKSADELFKWVDGPLINSMVRGEWFLLDEISLTEDSVLEKINSVLEFESYIVLNQTFSTKKASSNVSDNSTNLNGSSTLQQDQGSEVEQIRCVYSHKDFRLFGSMNPGNDFGKKELSPSLSNRFTQIYVPPIPITELTILTNILKYHNENRVIEDWFVNSTKEIIEYLIAKNINNENYITIRNLIIWSQYYFRALDKHKSDMVVVNNIMSTATNTSNINSNVSYTDDKTEYCKNDVNSNNGHQDSGNGTLKNDDMKFKLKIYMEGLQISILNSYKERPIHDKKIYQIVSKYANLGHDVDDKEVETVENKIESVLLKSHHSLNYISVLLEGSPGVGKTYGVYKLAEKLGKKLIRVNLNEYTDMSDLLGTFVPVYNTKETTGSVSYEDWKKNNHRNVKSGKNKSTLLKRKVTSNSNGFRMDSTDGNNVSANNHSEVDGNNSCNNGMDIDGNDDSHRIHPETNNNNNGYSNGHTEGIIGDNTQNSTSCNNEGSIYYNNLDIMSDNTLDIMSDNTLDIMSDNTLNIITDNTLDSTNQINIDSITDNNHQNQLQNMVNGDKNGNDPENINIVKENDEKCDGGVKINVKNGFKWVNGPLLECMINGYWLLLDELNLASSEILEGLNSVLDHRRDLYIPQLNMSLKCHEDFRIFATQNSVTATNYRKHMPRSFLNRFIRLSVPDLKYTDYYNILSKLFPGHAGLIGKYVNFIMMTSSKTVVIKFGQRNVKLTGLWNLRDLINIFKLIRQYDEERAIEVIVLNRLAYFADRTTNYQGKVESLVHGYVKHTLGHDIDNSYPAHFYSLISNTNMDTMELFNEENEGNEMDKFTNRTNRSGVRTRSCFMSNLSSSNRNTSTTSRTSSNPYIKNDTNYIINTTGSSSRNKDSNNNTDENDEISSKRTRSIRNNIYNGHEMGGLSYLLYLDYIQIYNDLLSLYPFNFPILIIYNSSHLNYGSNVVKSFHRLIQAKTPTKCFRKDQLKCVKLYSNSDINDLLGSYEQINEKYAYNYVCELYEKLKNCAIVHYNDIYHQYILSNGNKNNAGVTAKISSSNNGYMTNGNKPRNNSKSNGKDGNDTNNMNIDRDFVDEISKFAQYIHNKVSDINNEKDYIVRSMAEEIQRNIYEYKLTSDICLSELNSGNEGNLTFKWIDSDIIKSIESGDWLLINDIHLVSSSLLDRLNSLLEPTRDMNVNECGYNRKIEVSKEFRIFFTVHEDYIDRLTDSFLNRCIQINLNSLKVLNTTKSLLLSSIYDPFISENRQLFDLPLGCVQMYEFYNALNIVRNVVKDGMFFDRSLSDLIFICLVFVFMKSFYNVKKMLLVYFVRFYENMGRLKEAFNLSWSMYSVLNSNEDNTIRGIGVKLIEYLIVRCLPLNAFVIDYEDEFNMGNNYNDINQSSISSSDLTTSNTNSSENITPRNDSSNNTPTSGISTNANANTAIYTNANAAIDTNYYDVQVVENDLTKDSVDNNNVRKNRRKSKKKRIENSNIVSNSASGPITDVSKVNNNIDVQGNNFTNANNFNNLNNGNNGNNLNNVNDVNITEYSFQVTKKRSKNKHDISITNKHYLLLRDFIENVLSKKISVDEQMIVNDTELTKLYEDYYPDSVFGQVWQLQKGIKHKKDYRHYSSLSLKDNRGTRILYYVYSDEKEMSVKILKLFIVLLSSNEVMDNIIGENVDLVLKKDEEFVNVLHFLYFVTKDVGVPEKVITPRQGLEGIVERFSYRISTGKTYIINKSLRNYKYTLDIDVTDKFVLINKYDVDMGVKSLDVTLDYKNTEDIIQLKEELILEKFVLKRVLFLINRLFHDYLAESEPNVLILEYIHELVGAIDAFNPNMSSFFTTIVGKIVSTMEKFYQNKEKRCLFEILCEVYVLYNHYHHDNAGNGEKEDMVSYLKNMLFPESTGNPVHMNNEAKMNTGSHTSYDVVKNEHMDDEWEMVYHLMNVDRYISLNNLVDNVNKMKLIEYLTRFSHSLCYYTFLFMQLLYNAPYISHHLSQLGLKVDLELFVKCLYRKIMSVYDTSDCVNNIADSISTMTLFIRNSNKKGDSKLTTLVYNIMLVLINMNEACRSANDKLQSALLFNLHDNIMHFSLLIVPHVSEFLGKLESYYKNRFVEYEKQELRDLYLALNILDSLSMGYSLNNKYLYDYVERIYGNKDSVPLNKIERVNDEDLDLVVEFINEYEKFKTGYLKLPNPVNYHATKGDDEGPEIGDLIGGNKKILEGIRNFISHVSIKYVTIKEVVQHPIMVMQSMLFHYHLTQIIGASGPNEDLMRWYNYITLNSPVNKFNPVFKTHFLSHINDSTRFSHLIQLYLLCLAHNKRNYFISAPLASDKQKRYILILLLSHIKTTNIEKSDFSNDRIEYKLNRLQKEMLSLISEDELPSESNVEEEHSESYFLLDSEQIVKCLLNMNDTNYVKDFELHRLYILACVYSLWSLNVRTDLNYYDVIQAAFYYHFARSRNFDHLIFHSKVTLNTKNIDFEFDTNRYRRDNEGNLLLSVKKVLNSLNYQITDMLSIYGDNPILTDIQSFVMTVLNFNLKNLTQQSNIANLLMNLITKLQHLSSISSSDFTMVIRTYSAKLKEFVECYKKLKMLDVLEFNEVILENHKLVQFDLLFKQVLTILMNYLETIDSIPIEKMSPESYASMNEIKTTLINYLFHGDIITILVTKSVFSSILLILPDCNKTHLLSELFEYILFFFRGYESVINEYIDELNKSYRDSLKAYVQLKEVNCKKAINNYKEGLNISFMSLYTSRILVKSSKFSVDYELKTDLITMLKGNYEHILNNSKEMSLHQYSRIMSSVFQQLDLLESEIKIEFEIPIAKHLTEDGIAYYRFIEFDAIKSSKEINYDPFADYNTYIDKALSYLFKSFNTLHDVGYIVSGKVMNDNYNVDLFVKIINERTVSQMYKTFNMILESVVRNYNKFNNDKFDILLKSYPSCRTIVENKFSNILTTANELVVTIKQYLSCTNYSFYLDENESYSENINIENLQEKRELHSTCVEIEKHLKSSMEYSIFTSTNKKELHKKKMVVTTKWADVLMEHLDILEIEVYKMVNNIQITNAKKIIKNLRSELLLLVSRGNDGKVNNINSIIKGGDATKNIQPWKLDVSKVKVGNFTIMELCMFAYYLSKLCELFLHITPKVNEELSEDKEYKAGTGLDEGIGIKNISSEVKEDDLNMEGVTRKEENNKENEDKEDEMNLDEDDNINVDFNEQEGENLEMEKVDKEELETKDEDELENMEDDYTTKKDKDEDDNKNNEGQLETEEVKVGDEEDSENITREHEYKESAEANEELDGYKEDTFTDEAAKDDIDKDELGDKDGNELADKDNTEVDDKDNNIGDDKDFNELDDKGNVDNDINLDDNDDNNEQLDNTGEDPDKQETDDISEDVENKESELKEEEMSGELQSDSTRRYNEESYGVQNKGYDNIVNELQQFNIRSILSVSSYSNKQSSVQSTRIENIQSQDVDQQVSHGDERENVEKVDTSKLIRQDGLNTPADNSQLFEYFNSKVNDPAVLGLGEFNKRPYNDLETLDKESGMDVDIEEKEGDDDKKDGLDGDINKMEQIQADENDRVKMEVDVDHRTDVKQEQDRIHVNNDLLFSNTVEKVDYLEYLVKQDSEGGGGLNLEQLADRNSLIQLSNNLLSQLRIILEYNYVNSLKGYYKHGKRISIKKLMIFIATNYQRDKIWLKRLKPQKRDYFIQLAIDNTKSMSTIARISIQTIVVIYEAIHKLNIGTLNVIKFGAYTPEIILNNINTRYNGRWMSRLSFDEESKFSYETGLIQLFQFILSQPNFIASKNKILIIISDGKFNKNKVRKYLINIINHNIVPLLVVLDPQNSITTMKHIINTDGRIVIENYLDNFPFPYYSIISNINNLPNILSDLLRYLKLYVFLKLVSFNCGKRIAQNPSNNKGGVSNFLQIKNPISTAVDIITGANDGKKELNFGGGNLGAYYNFMYPDNSDYPWACVCNKADFELWLKKEQPYARCRNQEDLSLQDIQANCDPRNVTNYENIELGFMSPLITRNF